MPSRTGLAATARSLLQELGFPVRTATEPPKVEPGTETPAQADQPLDGQEPSADPVIPEPVPVDETPVQEPASVEPASAPVADQQPAPETSEPTAIATTTKPARFGAWIRNVFGVGASSPNDPLRLLSALGVAAVTGVISYDTLQQLATGMGFQDPGAHLFPIGIDLAVFLFTRTWMNRRLSETTRAMGKRSAIFFMVMSVAGNAIQHGKHAYDTWAVARATASAAHRTWQPSTMDIAWLAVTLVFSALMPLALGLSLHVISKVTDDGRRIRDEQAEQQAAADEPKPVRAKKRRRKTVEPEVSDPQQAEARARKDEKPEDAAEDARVIDLNQHSERPEWLTNELASVAKKAMFAYLDHNPHANGAELDRFGMRWLGTSKNYGRGVRREWLA